MNRQKIKLDLSSYLSIEKSANFRLEEQKAFNVIADLYKSKNEQSKMTGWLNLPYDEKMFNEIETFAEKILSEEKYENLLVIGIGGSSLGPQALIESLNTPLWNRLSKGKRKGKLTIDFIDNLDPQIIRTVLSRLKLEKTFFLVISKGGGTLETVVPMLIVKEWLGEEKFYKQSAFITTLNKGLLFELSKKYNVPVFSIPENVGGRFSVFSPVGLLPAALCGLNLHEIKEGIKEADRLCQENSFKENIAASVALSGYFSYKANKNIFVLMPYSTCMKKVADWFIQLWAESLGKSSKGSTPLPAVGATDQHSQIQMFNEGPNDKLVCFIKVNKHKKDLVIPDFSTTHKEFSLYSGKKVGKILNMELDATRKALTERNRANLLLTLPELDEYYLSQLLYIFEVSTAICGGLLDINPFDQPGVELAKKYTKEMLVVG